MPKGDQADPNGDVPVTSRCAPHDTLRSCAGLGAAAAALIGLAACSSGPQVTGPPIEVRDRSDRAQAAIGNEGSVFDMLGGGTVGNVTFGEGRTDALAASVNRHLWIASLDTLAFMPIASTDPFTGVIATDWASTPESPGERVKVTAFVTDTTLVADSLRVAVFREAQDGDGRWVTAPVDADVPRKIEDAILVRARQLRIAEEEAG
jgi:hypothetical protein